MTMVLVSLTQAFTPKVSFSQGGHRENAIAYFDDTPNILILQEGKLKFSQDDGVTFEEVKAFNDAVVLDFRMDEFDKKRAYVFTKSESQYVTFDQGKSWKAFKIPHMDNIHAYPSIISNAVKPEYVLFETTVCKGRGGRHCLHHFFATTDAFKSDPQMLPLEDATFCRFTRGNKESTIGKESSIVCSVDKKNSFDHVMESEIHWSDDFFKTSKIVSDSLKSAKNTQVKPIIDLRVEEQFIAVLVQNDRFNAKSSVTLYVSVDGINYKETNLSVNVVSGVIMFQKSSKLSIFLTVANYATRPAVGYGLVTATLYASDSTGLKFRKVLDDVEMNSLARVENIEGVWFANIVNKDSLADGEELMHSVISFDDGYHWDPLKINDESCMRSKDCSLHLSAIQQYSGEGTFVTGPAPGIIMGVGNIGKGLVSVLSGEQQTYISRDGGVSWTKAIDTMCIFSFGDQGNIIVAVPYYQKNMAPTNMFYYSLDQGKAFHSATFENPSYPISLITTIDGTSTKFFMTGLLGVGDGLLLGFYSMDFNEAFDGKKCGDDDMEEVYVRNVLPDGKPLCIYGRVEKFSRRKQDAQCLVKKLYEDVKINEEACECTGQDFECTEMFKLGEDGNCIPDPARIQEYCLLTGAKDFTSDNMRLITGDSCKNSETIAKKLVTNEKFVCSDYKNGKNGGDNNNGGSNSPIQTVLTKLQGKMLQYFYLEQADGINTDNVIARTDDNVCHISHDGGTTFKRLNTGEEVMAIYIGYVPGQVILVTPKPVIYVSFDAGNSFVEKQVPTKPASVIKTLSFHNTNSTTFIWYGSENCNVLGQNCDYTAYLTQDGGETFIEMAKDVFDCEFVGSHFESPANPDMMYCTGINKSTNKKALVSSVDYFEHGETVYDYITGFGVTGNYVVVALVEQDRHSLKAKVTVDGSTFADADFPRHQQANMQMGYTILDSVTKSIFLHVTTYNEVGSILKSNSNGTLYVMVLDNVNRNSIGYVDYERVESLEGVLFANIVESRSGESKNLQTLISHNDGAEWSLLPPPSVDSEGKKYSCIGKPLRECALHLHGYTERADFRDTFGSSSAVGVFIGIGNVGPKLEGKDQANTYISTDAGLTWKEIKRGEYMWEYGDRGTILVLVNGHEETNVLHYSLDEGNTWNDYQFTEDKVEILDLATVPSDSSRKFLIFARHGEGKSTLAYSIDFSGIHTRQCTLDLDNPYNDDFDFWTPVHPESSDNCLFGHEAKYLRRAVGHNDCFIGSAPLKEGFKVVRNCSCTRRDFECDFNYYRDIDNTCKLVQGLTPADRKKEMCEKDNAFEYFKPTGYRKIPLSTCVGGKNYASWDVEACPGKEKEFNQHHGREITGGKIGFLILVPLLVFLFAVWFVYDKGIRRNGGFKQLGQIRLDDDAGEDGFHPIEENNVDVVVNSVVRGGVYGLAVVIAGVKTIVKARQVILGRITKRLFRRNVGRRDYVHVPNIEEEDDLFGDFNEDFEGGEFDQDAVEDADIFVEEATPSQPDSGLFNIEDEEDNKP
ncbi:vacuolar protein sorting/targeting protein PEP1 [Scheffersomyces spartinae]|uniref:Vacuolar protein sorting/targeting protein PEP1 n=1 Tax=Scheffersomyces spartinae TaxID=45513 RepID=A0A9P8AK19_9ASCO|nr:vacuolar protein sorting/targeting protein PEP1 [Scheffersomyces spartinae]KAG7195436.1 vacuolar protein sorting/targeting protein PEP1 [Scheffersomyces spartinae]